MTVFIRKYDLRNNFFQHTFACALVYSLAFLHIKRRATIPPTSSKIPRTIKAVPADLRALKLKQNSNENKTPYHLSQVNADDISVPEIS